MNIRLIASALKFSVVASLVFLFLFSNEIGRTSPLILGSIVRKITPLFRDPATQWVAVLCLLFLFVICLILERRVGFLSSQPANINRLNFSGMKGWSRWIYTCCQQIIFDPNFWLASMVAWVFLRYAFTYQSAAHSMRPCVFLAGIVIGKAISTCVRWRNSHAERYALWLVGLLIFFLACAALWQAKPIIVYQYHGVTRWSGVWSNPNLYGLLMGTSAVLVLGIAILEWQVAGSRPRKMLITIYCLSAAILTIYCLFRSFSRGAWLAVSVGSIYLTIQAFKSLRFSPWFRRNQLTIAMLATSLLLLTFWQFRFSESLLAQRAFSVVNANDFSWRNRVTAWNGAIHMMVDRPLNGFGWGLATSEYQKNYLPPQLKDPGAIQTNDFFMLGISAGVPALFCFAAYLALSFRRSSAGISPPFSIFTTCRSASIVLLIGFWLDGGLFKLSVAFVFWTLMELARIETFTPLAVVSVQEVVGNDTRTKLDVVSTRGAWEISLRWLAGIMAVLAFAQITVYLGTPFLSVGDGTLDIARKCLIRPNETADFEFLSTNAIWRGQKLKILLEHVRLANYNRQLINRNLDDKLYQDYVLSPVITGNTDEQPDWRRPLWEEFYPRIRHESSPDDTAKIVLKNLHERVTITVKTGLYHNVPDIWLKHSTDEVGFEIIYVAALRSVGIPARLDSKRHVEFWDGEKWQSVPFVDEGKSQRNVTRGIM